MEFRIVVESCNIFFELIETESGEKYDYEQDDARNISDHLDFVLDFLKKRIDKL